MPIKDVFEIRLLPPFTIARVGSSPEPMDNYDVHVDSKPTEHRKLVPAETLLVKGRRIIKAVTPREIRFRDKEGNIRPVCPFFEVWARFEKDGQLEPLTLAHLKALNLKPGDVAWSVHVANWKAYRRTHKKNDKIEAKTGDFTDHGIHRLEGKCGNFKKGKSIPFGSVQYIRPTEPFPEIRLRFTPGPGKVYGPDARKADKNVVDDVYDSKKGTWARYVEGILADPYKTTPGQIYAGTGETEKYRSRGYLDDACDGIVKVRVAANGKTHTSFARITSSAPYFAPDSYHVRRLADDIEQLALGPDVESRDAVQLQRDVAEIVRCARDTVRLMSTEVMNGNQGVGGFVTNNRLNMAMITSYGDDDGTPDGDYGLIFKPIFDQDRVDAVWIRSRHETILRGVLETPTFDVLDRLSRRVRRHDEVGDLTDDGRQKMPAMMKGSDSLLLALTRRQVAKITAWRDLVARSTASPERDDPTWENCIKSYFNPQDVNNMLAVTKGWLDLSQYNHVKARAGEIYYRVLLKDMPPLTKDMPTPPWPDSRIATFKKWMDNGCPES